MNKSIKDSGPLPMQGRAVENKSVNTVAVLMGGWSNEHDVSMVSGAACAKGLRDAGYNVREIVVGRNLRSLEEALSYKPDVVFNALHGIGGEDGCIQSVLDILNLKYTHSGRLASALAMDKQRSKHIVSAAGVRICLLYTSDAADEGLV